MKRLLALLFVLPIFLPIVSQCTEYYFVGDSTGLRCPVVDAPQPCTTLCDGVWCWPPCAFVP